ncbi:MAG: flagellar hook-length control protein FliK [Deltaproteobacteria bacterium]|nr:flagellar hook-length control protein FliK [Deltaproteobacteria bacterium]
MVQVRILSVAGPQDQGLAMVELGGRLLQAQIPEGLPLGKPLMLQVVSPGPPTVLRPPDPPEELLSLLRSLKVPSSSYEQAATRLLALAPEAVEGPSRALLQELQGALRLPTAPADLAPALERLFRASGLFHESLLARGESPDDLKTLALRLLASLQGPSPLANDVEALVRHLEAHQARSVLDGMPVLPLFLPWGENGVRAEWAVEERTGSDGEGRAAAGCLRLRVEMPLLGPVEARVRWSPGGTSVRLAFSPPALSAASDRMEELSRALADAGVRVRGLRAEPLESPAPSAKPGMLELRA